MGAGKGGTVPGHRPKPGSREHNAEGEIGDIQGKPGENRGGNRETGTASVSLKVAACRLVNNYNKTT